MLVEERVRHGTTSEPGVVAVPTAVVPVGVPDQVPVAEKDMPVTARSGLP